MTINPMIRSLRAENLAGNYEPMHCDYPVALMTRRTFAMSAERILEGRATAPSAHRLRPSSPLVVATARAEHVWHVARSSTGGGTAGASRATIQRASHPVPALPPTRPSVILSDCGMGRVIDVCFEAGETSWR